MKGVTNRPDLQQMRLWIGTGENWFTMSRGSFRYKQKIQGKRELILQEREEYPEGIRLLYKDPTTDRVHLLVVENAGEGLKRVRYVAPSENRGAEKDQAEGRKR